MFESFFITSSPLSVETGSYQIPLVVLSYVVASFASYTALAMAQHLTTAQTAREKKLFHWGGSFAMGAGIWSMHFIGMLSYKMRMVVEYDPLLTFVSMLIAIAVAYGVLGTINRERLPMYRIVIAAISLGFGICAMHYTGMMAMKMDGSLWHTPGIFLLSVLIAIGASGAALWIAFTLARYNNKFRYLYRIGAALVMGGAICGILYNPFCRKIIMSQTTIQERPDLFSDPSIGLKIPNKIIRRLRDIAGSGASLALGFLAGHWVCFASAFGASALGGTAGAVLANPLLRGAIAGVCALGSLFVYKRIQYRLFKYDCCELPSAASGNAVKPARTPAARHRSVIQYAATGILSTGSAIFVPNFIATNMQCHISSIDYNRSVLLSCPNNTGSILVTISNQNQVVFINGADVGAMRMEMCNAPSQMWMPHCQPNSGIKPMTMAEAGGIFRTWSCCTTDKMMKTIEASPVNPYTRSALKQAVQNAWQGENLGPVHCPNPQAIKGQLEKGR